MINKVIQIEDMKRTHNKANIFHERIYDELLKTKLRSIELYTKSEHKKPNTHITCSK